MINFNNKGTYKTDQLHLCIYLDLKIMIFTRSVNQNKTYHKVELHAKHIGINMFKNAVNLHIQYLHGKKH